MKIALKPLSDGLENLPEFENHWQSLRDTEGPHFITSVYGIDFREGVKYYLLIPDKNHPTDVFFSRSEIFDIVDSELPSEWLTTLEEIDGVNSEEPPKTEFFGYPIFSRTETFIWRLSEGDLSNHEKSEIMSLLTK